MTHPTPELRAFLRDCGVPRERLDAGRPGGLDVMRRLCADLRAANARTNLTRLTDEEAFWALHVADSLLVGRVAGELLTEPLTVADVGCGGGFPLLPLAWANPRLAAVGIEPRRKKADFVAAEASALGLDNVSVVPLQAREAGRDAAHRGRYDAVCLRAVGPAARLIRHCRTLLRITAGARMIFYKTPAGVKSELKAAEGEARAHGLSASVSPVLALPDGQQRQFIIMAR